MPKITCLLLFLLFLLFCSVLSLSPVQASEKEARSVNLEWQLPAHWSIPQKPFARFRAQAFRSQKDRLFTGEITVTGRVGQSFIVCVRQVSSDDFMQTSAVADIDSVHTFRLTKNTGVLTITDGRTCPALFDHQYPYNPVQMIRSPESFLVTITKKKEPHKHNNPISVLPTGSSEPEEVSLTGLLGAGSGFDDHNDFKRPPFMPAPDKIPFGLLLLPGINLPTNWREYLPFAGLYHWLTDQPESSGGLTLLVQFHGQSPITLRISQGEYPEMAEHLLNARQLLLWLMPKLNGREALVQQLLDWMSDLPETGNPLEEATADAIRQRLLWVIEQSDAEFHLDIALQELADDLSLMQHRLSSGQPVIDQWPDGRRSQQSAQQPSSGTRTGQGAGSNAASGSQVSGQPSGVNNDGQEAGRSEEPSPQETAPSWLGGSGHYFVMDFPIRGGPDEARDSRRHFYIDQNQLTVPMKGQEKAKNIEAKSQLFDGAFTIKLDQIEEFMGIPREQRIQDDSVLAYLIRYGTKTIIQALYRFYGIDITRERDGFTLLHLAVDHQRHDLAELLIQHAARLNSGLLNKPDYSRRTPLHRACFQGDESMVRLLLNAGADTCLKDLWQKTPEDVVRDCGHQHLLHLSPFRGLFRVGFSPAPSSGWLQTETL